MSSTFNVFQLISNESDSMTSKNGMILVSIVIAVGVVLTATLFVVTNDNNDKAVNATVMPDGNINDEADRYIVRGIVTTGDGAEESIDTWAEMHPLFETNDGMYVVIEFGPTGPYDIPDVKYWGDPATLLPIDASVKEDEVYINDTPTTEYSYELKDPETGALVEFSDTTSGNPIVSFFYHDSTLRAKGDGYENINVSLQTVLQSDNFEYGEYEPGDRVGIMNMGDFVGSETIKNKAGSVDEQISGLITFNIVSDDTDQYYYSMFRELKAYVESGETTTEIFDQYIPCDTSGMPTAYSHLSTEGMNFINNRDFYFEDNYFDENNVEHYQNFHVLFKDDFTDKVIIEGNFGTNQIGEDGKIIDFESHDLRIESV